MMQLSGGWNQNISKSYFLWSKYQFMLKPQPTEILEFLLI
jgi:hypothetical protein